METDSYEITSFIPQRPPFVMIDRIISSGERTTISGFIIRKENLLVENGMLKEPGLVENIAQTAAARAGVTAQESGSPVRVGYIGAIRNLEISGFPKINDEIITEITVEKQIFDVSMITGKVSCNGSIIASCEMKIFIINQ